MSNGREPRPRKTDGGTSRRDDAKPAIMVVLLVVSAVIGVIVSLASGRYL